MPRLKDKPIELDEPKFIEWLLEVYYYRLMDQGVVAGKTALLLAEATENTKEEFLQQVRSQLSRFELAFPLTKLPALYAQALREISTQPSRQKPAVA